MRIYLASTSPRRRDLLARAGFQFECVDPGPEPETVGDPRTVAAVNARCKCAGALLPPGSPPGCVLGVDTVVELEGRLLGKPEDRDQARGMLESLAGREHLVHTAHCLRRHPGTTLHERSSTARVAVRELSRSELEEYLDAGEWVDKAGAYGIQGRAAAFCKLMAGAFETVVGLDLEAVRGLLAAADRG